MHREQVHGPELQREGGRALGVTEISPRSAAEAGDVAAALAGDEDAFRRLIEDYRRELHVHCYRMLGSFHDAEDALQETFLRAWRHRATFDGRSAYRAWLYRIATNVCLTAAARRRAEPAPNRSRTIDGGVEQVRYLTPYPDDWLDRLEATAGNPVARYDLRESVQLAFLTAVQLLPPRQRAVLILRDVLGWSAAEVAELLDATTTSVNSALQRARATLAHRRATGQLRTPVAPRDEIERSLVRRYFEAWEATDFERLVGILRTDAVLAMPPLGLRYVGRPAIAEFFATTPYPGAMASVRLAPTRANRQPAYGAYRRDPAGRTYRAVALVVLTVEGDEIAEITGFADLTLLPTFGLPTGLGPDGAPPNLI
jgi:RNA polymerase sigma-70 factor (TIGR02960 family)